MHAMCNPMVAHQSQRMRAMVTASVPPTTIAILALTPGSYMQSEMRTLPAPATESDSVHVVPLAAQPS